MKNHKIVRELTPELADKIINSFNKKREVDKISTPIVLHHLKQIKAQMGKELAASVHPKYILGIKKCMSMIDGKIEKLNKTN